jgi:hypothetical protein
MSAMPSMATESVRRNEPTRSAKSGREQSQQGSPYSITSSASASSLSGMVKAERLGGLEVDDKLEPMIMSVVPGFPRSKSRAFQL